MTEMKKFTRSPFVTLKDFADRSHDINNEDKPETNRGQIGDKVETNQRQIEDKLKTIGVQSEDKSRTQTRTNWRQIEDKLETKPHFSSLVGLQKALIIFIYNECNIARSKTTKNLSVNYISTALNSSYFSIKKTLQRLEVKRFIQRSSFKRGRGGWSKYTLPDHIFQEVLQYETEDKVRTNWRQIEDKSSTQTRTTAPVVSSSYINTTTNSLESIDLDELEDMGFSQSHLLQIEKEYQFNPSIALPAEEVQNSIYNFVFDLKHNKDKLRFKNDPITVLISLLRRGKPYNSVTPSKFKTPRQEALELYASAKEQREQEEAKTLEKIKSIEYDKWLNNLDEEELLSLYPESELPKGMPTRPRQAAWRRNAVEASKHYFDTAIWPSIKKNLP